MLFVTLFISLLTCSALARLPQATIPYGTRTVRSLEGQDVGPNAKRMAAGLAPLPPHRRSPTEAARRSIPSMCATVGFKGKIGVYKASTGVQVGYLSATLVSNLGWYTYTINVASAQSVTIPGASCSADTTMKLNLKDTTRNNQYTPFVGGSGSLSLSSSSSNYIYMTGVSTVSAGSTPSDSGYTTKDGTNYRIESAIWNFNSLSNSLAPQWINSDSSLVSTYIVYDPNLASSGSGGFVFTGSPSKYASQTGKSGSYEVDFKLIQ